jgi:hypothetical protein
LVKLFGGKCSRCGYCRYVGALDFHHKNPMRKNFSLSVKGLCYSWNIILKEAQKCVLLCKNCHAELENKKRRYSILTAGGSRRQDHHRSS